MARAEIVKLLPSSPASPRIARALAAPGRVQTLQTAWTAPPSDDHDDYAELQRRLASDRRWFWTAKWEVLLAHAPEEHRHVVVLEAV